MEQYTMTISVLHSEYLRSSKQVSTQYIAVTDLTVAGKQIYRESKQFPQHALQP
jgi:hypothetical protein